MGTHTPGPWIVAGPSENENEAEVISDATEGRAIASTWDTYCDETDETHTSDEDRANARLIAAAPDMLTALRVITSDARIMGWLTRNDPKALQQADDAIGKATGGLR